MAMAPLSSYRSVSKLICTVTGPVKTDHLVLAIKIEIVQ